MEMAKQARAPRSREDTKQETRQALILAGLSLFAEEGLDGPSLDAICERAGFTRGAFYVHFKDRDDFLVAVMDQVGVAYLDAIIGGGLQPTVQRFISSIASGTYPLTAKGGVKPHQLIDACARSPRIRKRYVELVKLSIDRLAALVRAGQGSMVRADVEAGEVAALLLAVVIGAQTMMELEVPIDYAKMARTMLALLA
jgi:TetR/AcrR family transcriptional regulator, transcriptional repressor for nem operon